MHMPMHPFWGVNGVPTLGGCPHLVDLLRGSPAGTRPPTNVSGSGAVKLLVETAIDRSSEASAGRSWSSHTEPEEVRLEALSQVLTSI